MSHSEKKQARQVKGITRRGFLASVSATAAGLLVAACAPATPTAAPAQPAPTQASATAAPPEPTATAVPVEPTAAPTAVPALEPTATAVPAPAAKRSVHFLRGSSYVKDEDTWFSEYLVENWAKPNDVELVVEALSTADMAAKVSVAFETGVGPDIVRFAWDQPLLYAKNLSDLGDVAEKQEADGGGYYDVVKAFCYSDGVWLGVPFGMVGNAVIYRADWLEELGETQFPDTWEEYNRVGKMMKEQKNAPTGQNIAHDTGDPRHCLYPLLWSFGGKEVLEDGRTVAISSSETLDCLNFFAEWYRDSLSPEMLGWDGNGNNRAYLGEQIWATNNAASLFLSARKDFPGLADATQLTLNPQGPAGRFHTAGPYTHSIPTYVKDPSAAKDLLSFIAKPEVFSDFMKASKGYTSPACKIHENDPMWDLDPKMAIFKDISFYRWPGYPGPPSAKSGEVVNKYIIIDMFAKVCQGDSPEQAIEWCEAQLKPIYEQD